MVTPQAAIMVLDHLPDSDEVSEYAAYHLEEFEADEAYATCEIMYSPPSWLGVHEQDQMGAHLRDLPGSCILVIYMQEGDMEGDEEF
jgi:hypothetical protein